MSRLQVYLPDELHRKLKDAGISPSELLQEAVRSELQRRERIGRLDEYLRELRSELGEPSSAERARADTLVRRLTKRRPGRPRTVRRAS